MLAIHYRNRFFAFTEWIGKGEAPLNNGEKTDVLLKIDLAISSPKKFISYEKGMVELHIPNYIIDLDEGEEELFKNIQKRMRTDIRRAMEKDNFDFVEIARPTAEEIKEFKHFYDSFAKMKNTPLCNEGKLISLMERKALMLTYVKDETGEVLCGGASILDKASRQFYALYGFSNRLKADGPPEKRRIGRANKLLHWKEIQLAKRMGFKWYNFGGEVHGDEGVNGFKKRFGASQGYDRRIYSPRTFFGKICVLLIYFKWKKTLKEYKSLQTGAASTKAG